MTDGQQERARQVVKQFKDRLDPDIRASITLAQYEDLEQLVRSAIAQELQEAAEVMENTVRYIRKEVERPQIEL